MAIYRKGEASLAADGTVTGYGTNWKDQLALVRIGATIVFLNGNAIGAIGTVSAIVSETQLQTIQSDGAVVARGKYFILLHDSLTVDGLAQNVAETLRYYQSSETEIADALDYFRTFDWEKFEKVAKDVKANAAAAKVSETNAKTSETNAKGSENAAAASKTAAAASQAAAKTSENNAKTSETNAKASENAAAGSKTAAAGSATDAAASKTAAAASQAAAKTSETNAKTSETNAKASENASLQSKNSAAGSATAAKTSETNSKTSETRAKTSETNSKTSETNAKTSEINAENWAKSVNPANLAQLDTANTFKEGQTFSKGIRVAGSYADALLIESANPTIKFRENDKPAGAPDYAFVMDGGNFRIQREDSGASLLSYNKDTNTITMTKAAFGDVAQTRVNLGLGTNDRPEFSALYARDGIEVRTFSDNANPAASLVSRRGKANGDTIVSSEMRANANGSVEWIKRDSAGTPRSISLTEDNYVQFGGLTIAPPNMELGIKNPNNASFIDFHYGAKYDYDARIICDGMNSDQVGGGNLRLNAGFLQLNSKGSTNVTGGRFHVNGSDAVFDTQVGFSSGRLQIPNESTETAPVGAGLRGIYSGVDSYDYAKACNINLYSWYSVGFCSAFNNNTNGIVNGKPAVMINVRNGEINTKGVVISKGAVLTSDARAKTDIIELDGDYVSDVLDKVGTYSYRYKEGSRYTAGVIAQELQIWLPQLVSTSEADGTLQVDYMGLVGYLHAGFKAEKEKSKALESRLKKLESYLAFKFPEDFE